MKKLAVIIPVRNEGEIAEKVFSEWIILLNKLNIDYDITAYDGNSQDNTVEILKKLSLNNPNLILKEMPAIGHGPTLVKAYKECSADYEWIFQADSDNEISPSEFVNLWDKKDNYDLLTGIRQNRVQSLSRKILTLSAKILLKCLCGTKTPKDTNCPYRLMRSSVFETLYEKLPDNIQAPNILISAFCAKHKIKFLEIPVSYKFRQTGTVSINKIKLLKIAIKSFMQTVILYNKI